MLVNMTRHQNWIFKKICNLTLLIDKFRKEEVRVIIGSEDIVKGNEKLILGFLWGIMKRYTEPESVPHPEKSIEKSTANVPKYSTPQPVVNKSSVPVTVNNNNPQNKSELEALRKKVTSLETEVTESKSTISTKEENEKKLLEELDSTKSSLLDERTQWDNSKMKWSQEHEEHLKLISELQKKEQQAITNQQQLFDKDSSKIRELEEERFRLQLEFKESKERRERDIKRIEELTELQERTEREMIEIKEQMENEIIELRIQLGVEQRFHEAMKEMKSECVVCAARNIQKEDKRKTTRRVLSPSVSPRSSDREGAPSKPKIKAVKKESDEFWSSIEP